MNDPREKPAERKPYEPPTVASIIIDPLQEMLAGCSSGTSKQSLNTGSGCSTIGS